MNMKFKVREMDGLLKENGTANIINASSSASNNNVVKPSITSVQSVIQQPNQQSVIQTVSGPTVLTKGNVIIVGKPNSVIQTAQGNLQTLHVMVSNAQGTTDDEESLSPRAAILKKRHSDNNGNINNDNNSATTSATITQIKLENNMNSELCAKIESSGSDDDSNLDSELSSHSISMSNHYHSVLPDDSLSIPSQNSEVHGLSSITMTSANSSNAGTILHYTGQDGQFYVPGEIVVMQNPNGDAIGNTNLTPEDPLKKRELRLMKNREAARECRRKKKEYIKCLENRVAVLETQNKALIDELKSLKELYCLQKSE